MLIIDLLELGKNLNNSKSPSEYIFFRMAYFCCPLENTTENTPDTSESLKKYSEEIIEKMVFEKYLKKNLIILS